MKTGKAEHAYLGVKMQTIDETLAILLASRLSRASSSTTVQPGSPADEAG